MKLVILLQGVHKERITEKGTSTKIEERTMEGTSKTKRKKSCYIANEQESNENDDEVVYVAMKDEFDEDEATTLMTCVNKNDK